MRTIAWRLLTSSLHHAVAVLILFISMGGWPSAVAEQPAGPQELVQDTTARLLAAVRAERETIRRDSQRLYGLVEDILLPVVDRERVSRWVLGRHWRNATAEQRSRFTEEFQTMLIRTYSAPLLDYTAVEITYLPFEHDLNDTDAVIRTQIHYGERKPLSVYYSLHFRDGAWKVYDVTVAGVSAVTTFRATFSEQIQKVGLEEFIRQLSEQNRRRQQAIDASLNIHD